MDESNGFKVDNRQLDFGANGHTWSTLTAQNQLKAGKSVCENIRDVSTVRNMPIESDGPVFAAAWSGLSQRPKKTTLAVAETAGRLLSGRADRSV